MDKNQIEIEVIKEIQENHENHFAMVENFVEKFIPVRIQSQISETLNEALKGNDAVLDRLYTYEKGRLLEMHQVILDDDGAPNLINQLRDIQFDINTIYDIDYKGNKEFSKDKPSLIEKLKKKRQEEKKNKMNGTVST